MRGECDVNLASSRASRHLHVSAVRRADHNAVASRLQGMEEEEENNKEVYMDKQL